MVRSQNRVVGIIRLSDEATYTLNLPYVHVIVWAGQDRSLISGSMYIVKDVRAGISRWETSLVSRSRSGLI